MNELDDEIDRLYSKNKTAFENWFRHLCLSFMIMIQLEIWNGALQAENQRLSWAIN